MCDLETKRCIYVAFCETVFFSSPDFKGDAIPSKKEPISAFEMATKRYNKRYRKDALLQKQSKDKRLGVLSRSQNQTLSHQRCLHYTDGNRCVSKIIPSTKFCIKRIQTTAILHFSQGSFLCPQ